jgi:hypothetical protein
LEGEFCTPSAERTKPSTMTIRVKLVISMTIEGASVQHRHQRDKLDRC